MEPLLELMDEGPADQPCPLCVYEGASETCPGCNGMGEVTQLQHDYLWQEYGEWLSL